MHIDIYFDGTGISLDSSTEKRYGKSVVGYAFMSNPANERVLNLFNYDTLIARDKRLSGGIEDIKIYFPGPAAENSSYNGNKYHRPGTNYNPGRISSAVLSRYNTKNRTAIYGDGWEHNLQLALLTTLDLVAEVIKNINDKITINIPAAYSRGAITAIAFSDVLSETLQSMGYSQKNVSIGKINLIDPVAGGDYGKWNKSIERHDYKNDLHSVSPLKIGCYTEKLTLHVATQERRKSFKPQLPYGLDLELKNNRPLFIPDSVQTNIRFSHACHQTIAYPEYQGQAHCFPSGCETYRMVKGEQFKTHKLKDDTWKHFAKDSSDIIFPKASRGVHLKTNVKKPENIIEYDNSILYDVYNYFMINSNGSNTFQEVFRDTKNRYNNLVIWAYKNSNFYRITKITHYDISDNVLSQAISCKSRESLTMLAMLYKYYKIYNTPIKKRRLDHQSLEKIILAPKEQHKDYIYKNIGHNGTYLDRLKQIAINAINIAMIHLRASSTSDKLNKLIITKAFIEKARDKDQCASLLYLAIRIVQHNMGAFHFRLKVNYSKDFHQEDFDEAIRQLGGISLFNSGAKYAYYKGIKITFSNFSILFNLFSLDLSAK